MLKELSLIVMIILALFQINVNKIYMSTVSITKPNTNHWLTHCYFSETTKYMTMSLCTVVPFML